MAIPFFTWLYGTRPKYMTTSQEDCEEYAVYHVLRP